MAQDFFLDENGSPVKEINRQNLEAYKNWIASRAEARTDGYFYPANDFAAADEVKLAELIPERMTENQKMYVGRVIYSALNNSPRKYDGQYNIVEDKRTDEFLTLAEKYPDTVGRVVNLAGNATGGFRDSVYSRIAAALDKRSMIENLEFVNATLTHPTMLSLTGKKEQKTEKLTPLQKKILSGWVQKGGAGIESTYMYDILRSGELLNCKNLPTEVRKKVNEYAVQNYQWNNLKSEFMDRETLKAIFAQNKKIDRVQSRLPNTNAKTQKEKNSGILPEYYINLRDAVFREVNNMRSYGSFGKEKTLNAKFLEFSEEVTGRKFVNTSVPGQKIDRTSLLYDVYLYTAQKDISEGHAADLDTLALQEVLVNDRDNYYLRKIKPEVLEQKGIRLQGNIVAETLKYSENNTPSDYLVKEIAESNLLTEKEKEKVVKLAENDKNYPSREGLAQKKTRMQEYEEAVAVMGDAAHVLQEKDSAKRAAERLRDAYAGIVANFKNKEPNEQEAEILSKDKIERQIANHLASGSNGGFGLSTPVQKGLPLLFGRKEEQMRRQRLADSIKRFNAVLAEMPKSDTLRKYAGRILTDDTAKKLQSENEHAKAKYNKLNNELQEKYPDFAKHLREEIAVTESHYSAVDKARAHLKAHKEMLAELAKERVGVPEKSDLQDVSALSGEEKHNARAANKKRGRDKLAERAEKNKGLTAEQKKSETRNAISARKYAGRREI